jgi:hypothetical protein
LAGRVAGVVSAGGCRSPGGSAVGAGRLGRGWGCSTVGGRGPGPGWACRAGGGGRRVDRDGRPGSRGVSGPVAVARGGLAERQFRAGGPGGPPGGRRKGGRRAA